MAKPNAIFTLLNPSLESMGYRLVQASMTEQFGRRTLQILADRHDGKRIEVTDCEAISHRASAILDVENAVEGAYDLEVSSPGIDRPLISAEDFADYIGFEAKVEMEFPLNGRKRFKGLIQKAEGDVATLTCDNEDFDLNIGDIRSAKLVLTDALIKETAKRAGK